MLLTTVLKRVAMLIPVLAGVAIVTFILILLIPGDPSDSFLPPETPPDVRAEYIRDLGLDRPAHERFAAWVTHALRGDFGTSIKRHEPAATVVIRALGNTTILAGFALVLSLVGGLLLGAGAAHFAGRMTRQGRAVGSLLNGLSIAMASIPSFWFGLVLIYLFVVQLRALPVGGAGPFIGDASPFELARYLVLPVMATALHPMAITARYSRTLLLEIAQQDFVLMLRSRGYGQMRILRHQMRNVLPGMVSLVGLQAGSLLGGALFAEQVFSRPGLGTAITEAIAGRDYPVIQVAILVTGLLFAVVTILVDVLIHILDRRVSAA